MTAASEQLAQAMKAAKPSKFRAVRSQSSDGKWFASKKERDRYEHLMWLVRVGEISHLECQPKFPLLGKDGSVLRSEKGRALHYLADFAYFDGRSRVVEDVKSKATKTQLYRLKKALVEASFPAIKIVEV